MSLALGRRDGVIAWYSSRSASRNTAQPTEASGSRQRSFDFQKRFQLKEGLLAFVGFVL